MGTDAGSQSQSLPQVQQQISRVMQEFLAVDTDAGSQSQSLPQARQQISRVMQEFFSRGH